MTPKTKDVNTWCIMNTHVRFRKTQEREFSAHHMLLHAAELAIEEAEKSRVGRFNKCLSAMVMSSLAVEALANAVGSRLITDWTIFERLSPLKKIGVIVKELTITYDPKIEPWSSVRWLAGFRNDIAHAKPELVQEEKLLPEVALGKTLFRLSAVKDRARNYARKCTPSAYGGYRRKEDTGRQFAG